jgi:hypothetical protein
VAPASSAGSGNRFCYPEIQRGYRANNDKEGIMYRKVALCAALLFASHASGADDTGLLTEARFVARSLPPKLLNVIQAEVEKRGTEQALVAYSHLSPKILADAAQETGWEIRQISPRNRNPKGLPDTWESGVLDEFARRIAAGEPPIHMDKGEVVVDGGKRYYRYMQPMMMQRVCMECHGPEDAINPGVRQRIKELYPEDRATGYTDGMMRGALTLRRAL